MNARGSRPRLSNTLRFIAVGVSDGDRCRRVAAPATLVAAEILIETARPAESYTFFGWAADGPGDFVNPGA